MDVAHDESSQGEELAGEVMEDIGEPAEKAEEINESHDAVGHENSNDPLYVQKRLKRQERAHNRRVNEMSSRISELENKLSQNSSDISHQENPYAHQSNGSGVDEQIHKAVSYALKHKEMEDRKAKDAEHAAHVNREYQGLHSHLDKMSDKYDDFDDVVRGNDAPFTSNMRDVSLLLPRSGPGSAGEVLYKLGNNREELHRISKLHPLQQASEMVKLSHALINGGESKQAAPRTLGTIKSNPVTNSHVVTEKTPVSSIRQRMKKGTWK